MRAGAVSNFVTSFWNSTPPTGLLKTKHNFHIESLDLNMFLLSLLACSWGTWNNVPEGEIISHSSPHTKSHFSSLFSHPLLFVRRSSLYPRLISVVMNDPPGHFNYRCVPPCLASADGIEGGAHGFMNARQELYQLSYTLSTKSLTFLKNGGKSRVDA